MRDGRIDIMRSFCNVLVLATHAYPFMYAANHGVEFWFCTLFSRHFAMIILPTLFFVSGYCMFIGNGGGYLSKIKSRVRRLVLPYFAWNIVFLLLYLALGLVSEAAYKNLVDWDCLSFVGCIKRLLVINETVIDGPMWFVRCLFVLCLFYPLLRWMYRNFSLMFIVVLGFAVVILGDTLFSKYYPSYAFASFVIGGCISYHKIDVFDFVRKYRSIFWIVSIGALLGGFAWSIYRDSIAEPASVVKFLTIPMFYLMFDWISKVMRHRLVSKFVSPLSFTLYASHIFFHYCNNAFNWSCASQDAGKYGYSDSIDNNISTFVCDCYVARRK